MTYLMQRFDTGEFLAWFDPDWTPDGSLPSDRTGLAKWTKDPLQAIPFDSIEALHKEWTRQSSIMPIRHDGKPNRPLTAYTIIAIKSSDVGIW